MQYPGPTNYKTDAWPPSQITICARCIASRLLIPEANKSDPYIDSFLRYLDHRYTHDAKDDCNTEISKTARDYTRARWRRHDGEMARRKIVSMGCNCSWWAFWTAIERWVARVKGGWAFSTSLCCTLLHDAIEERDASVIADNISCTDTPAVFLYYHYRNTLRTTEVLGSKSKYPHNSDFPYGSSSTIPAINRHSLREP